MAKICIVAKNSVVRDGRILKQADSLASAGHAVTILGLMDAHCRDPESLRPSGVRILRKDYRAFLGQSVSIWSRLHRVLKALEPGRRNKGLKKHRPFIAVARKRAPAKTRNHQGLSLRLRIRKAIGRRIRRGGIFGALLAEILRGLAFAPLAAALLISAIVAYLLIARILIPLDAPAVLIIIGIAVVNLIIPGRRLLGPLWTAAYHISERAARRLTKHLKLMLGRLSGLCYLLLKNFRALWGLLTPLRQSMLSGLSRPRHFSLDKLRFLWSCCDSRLTTATSKARAKAIGHAVNTILADGIVALQPDVIHCHDLDPLAAGLAAKWRLRCPVIFDAHEIYEDIAQGNQKLKARWKAILRKSDRYVDAFIWDYQILDEQAMNRSPFYMEFLPRIDWRYFIDGIIANSERDFAAVVVHRSQRQGHVDRVGIATMQRLLPHVRQAFDVARRLNCAGQTAGVTDWRRARSEQVARSVTARQLARGD